MNVLTDQSQSTMLVIFKLRAKKKKRVPCQFLASIQVYLRPSSSFNKDLLAFD